jgi:multiple antibiotic resistance protein
MMHEMTGHALTVFMGFFAIMNPLANTPVFIGLTAEDSPEVKRRIAAKALLLTFILIVIFSVLGRLIFDLFGITLPAFQITGGILVFMVGTQMAITGIGGAIKLAR